MNILADEGVDRQIVARLRQDGHNVLYVAEMAPGITDDEVLDLANQEGRLLLTADRDFGELVFRQRRIMPGIILMRLAGLTPDRKGEVVAAAIKAHSHDLERAFSVVMPNAIRVRRSIHSS